MTETHPFLGAGLLHFHDGLRAVNEFSDRVLTILRRTVKSPGTRAMSLRPIGYRTAVVGKPSKGSRICASTMAMIGDVEGQVELGLWWRPPEMGRAVLAYTNFSKPEPLLRFRHKPRRRSINCYPIDGASRLFVAIASSWISSRHGTRFSWSSMRSQRRSARAVASWAEAR